MELNHGVWSALQAGQTGQSRPHQNKCAKPSRQDDQWQQRQSQRSRRRQITFLNPFIHGLTNRSNTQELRHRKLGTSTVVGVGAEFTIEAADCARAFT
jgi:transcription elongation GreA/GreB family factor